MGRVRSCWLLHLGTAVRTPPRQKARPSQPARRKLAGAENLATSVRTISFRRDMLLALSSSLTSLRHVSEVPANNRLFIISNISTSSLTFLYSLILYQPLRVRSCQEDICTILYLPNRHTFIPQFSPFFVSGALRLHTEVVPINKAQLAQS